ncbi:MAG: tetratricopeptide repeat protein [Verrucomicrobia bacterium]|nr:tetratricopeptide repeat protein [Verrucomicrobiota bacterium]
MLGCLRCREREAGQSHVAGGTRLPDAKDKGTEAALLLERAAAAHRAGRTREALALYDQVLTHDRTDIDAIRYGGMAQLQLGDARAAITRLKIAVLLAPKDAPSHLLLGNAYESLQQSEMAVPCFEKAIEFDPGEPQAHHNLAVALTSMDRLDEATAAYRRALELKPDYAQAHSNLAKTLQAAGRYDEAIASARAAIALQSDFVEAYRNLGNALYDSGRLDEAADAYRDALTLAPTYEPVRQALLTALMQMDAHAQAFEVCEEGLRLTPGRATLLAYKGVVLDHLSEHAAAAALRDLDQLVWSTTIVVPDSFQDLDDFNESLRNHALARGNMIVETPGADGRFNKATRDGGYIRELHNEPKGPIAAFEHIIESAVETYLQSRAIDPSHPFLAARPERWRFEIWGNFLGSAGHLTTHHHPAGWLSGVYYSHIPGSMTASDPAHGGWIEFGRPHSSLPEPAGQRIKLVQPEEGLMILFPSFVFHRTLPNPTADERISFGFDLCPV